MEGVAKKLEVVVITEAGSGSYLEVVGQREQIRRIVCG